MGHIFGGNSPQQSDHMIHLSFYFKLYCCGSEKIVSMPFRAGPPEEYMRSNKPWLKAFIVQCYQGSFYRPPAGQPTGRGDGVSSETTNALRPENRLQRFSGIRNRTRDFPCE